MSKSNKLFDLIKNLTPNEKRYITQFSQNSDSQHVQLFEFLDQLKDYNEDQILKELERNILKDKYTVAKYSYLKNYLFEFILKALRSYNSDNFQHTQINGYISDIEYFLTRGLYEHCVSRIQQAKKVIIQQEQHPYLFIITNLERQCIVRYQTKHAEEQIDEIRDNELKSLQEMAAGLEYRNLADTVFLITRKEFTLRDPEKVETLQKLYLHPLLTNVSKSFENNILRLQILANIANLLRQRTEARAYQRELIELYETKNTNYKFDGRYLKLLNNYLSRSNYLEHKKEFLKYFEAYKEYKKEKYEIQANVFSRLIYHKLPFYLNTSSFQDAYNALEELIAGLSIYNKLITVNRKLSIATNISACYFIHEEFDKMISWLDYIIEQDKNEVRKDLHSYARLMSIIVHYETDGDVAFLQSLKRSLKRKLQKENRMYNFENEILRSIESISKKGDFDSSKLKILKKLDHFIVSFKKSNPGNFAGLDEISLWVKSKIENKRILELLIS